MAMIRGSIRTFSRCLLSQESYLSRPADRQLLHTKTKSRPHNGQPRVSKAPLQSGMKTRLVGVPLLLLFVGAIAIEPKISNVENVSEKLQQVAFTIVGRLTGLEADTEERWQAHVAEASRLGYMGRVDSMVRIEIGIPWSILVRDQGPEKTRREVDRILSRAFWHIHYMHQQDGPDPPSKSSVLHTVFMKFDMPYDPGVINSFRDLGVRVRFLKPS